MQQRYYDPLAGRFFSTDPVSTNGNTGENFNRYWFALNNPYRYVDPDGRAPCEMDCKERLKAADDTVAKDARTLIGLAGGPLNAIVDLVQGAATGDSKMAAQGAASAMMEAAIPELETVKVTANAVRTAGSAIWSSTKIKSGVENALGHWNKHAVEFPEIQNSKQYTDAAHSLINNPPSGVLSKSRGSDTLIYDPATNTFVVKDINGSPRTMFRPVDGMNYWNKQ